MSWFRRLAGALRGGDAPGFFRDSLAEATALQEECRRLRADQDEALRRHDEELDSRSGDLEQRLEQAREEGRCEARSELAHGMEDLHQAAESLARLRAEVLTGLETELRRLALTVARRLLKVHLEDRPELFGEMVREVVADHLSSERLEVHVHPERLELLRETFAGQQVEIVVATDRALGPWDFELRLDSGCIDGSLDAQLDQLARHLAERPLDLVAPAD